MFNNKINGNFNEESKSINTFISSIKKELKSNSENSKIIWIIFSILIATTNIILIILSSIALKKTIDNYKMYPNVSLSEVVPAALVSALSITLFILSIVISVYQGVMKSKTYKEAKEDVQYLMIAYLNKQIKIDEVEFKKQINDIVSKARKHKNNKSYKKIILSILTGGNNE